MCVPYAYLYLDLFHIIICAHTFGIQDLDGDKWKRERKQQHSLLAAETDGHRILQVATRIKKKKRGKYKYNPRKLQGSDYQRIDVDKQMFASDASDWVKMLRRENLDEFSVGLSFARIRVILMELVENPEGFPLFICEN